MSTRVSLSLSLSHSLTQFFSIFFKITLQCIQLHECCKAGDVSAAHKIIEAGTHDINVVDMVRILSFQFLSLDHHHKHAHNISMEEHLLDVRAISDTEIW